MLKRLIKLLGQKVQQSWAKSDAPGGAVGSGMLGGAGAAAAADGMPGIFSTLLIFQNTTFYSKLKYCDLY